MTKGKLIIEIEKSRWRNQNCEFENKRYDYRRII